MKTSYRYQKDTIGGNFWETVLTIDTDLDFCELWEGYQRTNDRKLIKEKVKNLTFEQAQKYILDNSYYLIEQRRHFGN